jgi:endonuclease-3 related protein
MELRLAAPSMRRRLEALYAQLLSAYGPQGWWPLSSRSGKRSFDARGYHRGVFVHPRTAEDRFEIAMGAILTQNSAWTNAETALERLRKAGIRLPSDIHSHPKKRLARLIRSSGYFNQKARKLKEIAVLFRTTGSLAQRAAPSREKLLSCWGIGPETADSILLYAFRMPFFVVDTYTRRLLDRTGILEGALRLGYDDIQKLFLDALPHTHQLFNEYHALIVEHAKQHCRSKPLCGGCPVLVCRYRDSARASPRPP